MLIALDCIPPPKMFEGVPNVMSSKLKLNRSDFGDETVSPPSRAAEIEGLSPGSCVLGVIDGIEKFEFGVSCVILGIETVGCGSIAVVAAGPNVEAAGATGATGDI